MQHTCWASPAPTYMSPPRFCHQNRLDVSMDGFEVDSFAHDPAFHSALFGNLPLKFHF